MRWRNRDGRAALQPRIQRADEFSRSLEARVKSRVIDLEMMLENAGSKSGTIVSGGGTSDSTILNISWLNVPASNGTRPVMASYKITPME